MKQVASQCERGLCELRFCQQRPVLSHTYQDDVGVSVQAHVHAVPADLGHRVVRVVQQRQALVRRRRQMLQRLLAPPQRDPEPAPNEAAIMDVQGNQPNTFPQYLGFPLTVAGAQSLRIDN
jgi:hypothetical protein